MDYPTIDYLNDLTPVEMGNAIPLSFKPFVNSGSAIDWDNVATYSSSQPYALLHSTFKWTATSGATYDIASHSYFDPFIVEVYDNLGNVVAATSYPDTTYGSDYVWDFKAPYSGTFYVSAGWDQGNYDKFVSLSIYEDVDTIPKPVPPTVPPIAPPVVAPLVNNSLVGTSGNDVLLATKANDIVNGGDGYDTMVYAGVRSAYSIVKNGDVISVSAKSGLEGVDTLRNVEKIQFADRPVSSDYNDITQALYVSYFGRAADTGGLENFQSQLALLGAPRTLSGLSAAYSTNGGIKNLIDSFGASEESKALYSGDTKAFVKAIYQNVLNRAPDQGGLDFWAGAIDSGNLTRANASLSIMSGAQSNTTAQGKIDGALVANKISVSSNFTFGLDTADKSSSYSGNAAAATARNLLSSVNSETDIAAFQTTVNSTLTTLFGAQKSSGLAVTHLPADDAGIQLVGIPAMPDAHAILA